MFAQFYAKYCYFPDYLREQYPASELAIRPDPTSEAGVRAIKSSMPRIQHDLRRHAGTARAFSPAVWWVQRMLLILSAVLVYFAGAGWFAMLVPVAAWLGSRLYFQMRGWRWLQSGCRRHASSHAAQRV